MTFMSAALSEVAYKLHSKNKEAARSLDKLLWHGTDDQGFFSDSKELQGTKITSGREDMYDLWDRGRTGTLALCLEKVGGGAPLVSFTVC